MPLDTSTALSATLRESTRQDHADAERAGLMPALLGGRLPRPAYAALLRNLQAIYGALEPALDAHATHPCIAPIWQPALRRGAALSGDLSTVTPAEVGSATLAPATHAYVAHIQQLCHATPHLLVAHAYVRYLGDLSGGQVLARIVARAYGADVGVQFYDFGSAEQARALALAFRAALDALPLDADTAARIVEEAREAFARHRDLFNELRDTVPG